MLNRPTSAMNKREHLQSPLLWFDANESPALLGRALESGYTGVMADSALLPECSPRLSDRITRVLNLKDADAVPSDVSGDVVVASPNRNLLSDLSARGIPTAFRAYVDDAQSLHDAIEVGKEHPYVVMSFKDPTNIPLELVIASLQSSDTILIKEIATDQVDDAIVTLGVMEVGAEGVLFSPTTHEAMDQFLTRWTRVNEQTTELQPAEVVSSRPIGMGTRSCIDLTTLFTPTEGLIVGSTSHGGILCCPEVFFLPYMELRPFRVNAGAVHSYVYNSNNRTDYMTELRAGSPVMVVDSTGRSRTAHVGRMKTEVRPLRLIDVKFENGSTANLILQDDWHVRIYSADAKPMNITELRPGDRVLGHPAQPGRHVGIKVSEHILET